MNTVIYPFGPRLRRAETVLVLLLAVLPLAAFGQVAMVRTAARELFDTLVQKGTRESAEELMKLGGETAVREALEQAEKEGGEQLLKRAAQYAEKYGIGALQGLKRAPKALIRGLDELPADAAEKALQAVRREPDLMGKLVTDFGADALRVAAQHPGVGSQIAKALGRDGIQVAKELSTESAIKLARLSDNLAKLPPAERSQVWAVIKEAPTKFIDLLERHPKVLLTTAGVASFVAAKKELLGGSEVVVGEDGKIQVVTKPGLLDRATDKTFQSYHWQISAVVLAAGFILLAWGGVKVWGAWRITRARVSKQEARIRKEGQE